MLADTQSRNVTLAVLRSALTASIAVLTCLAGSSSVWAIHVPEHKPDILVLMSYHHGYSWENSILEGIEQWDNTREGQPTFHIEWMDTKRYPDQARRENISRYLKTKYRDHHFDLVITVDDNALELALRGGAPFDDKPIVFSGVNGDPVAMIGTRTGVTGIAERFGLSRTLELALRLHPDASQLLFITSDNETGAGTRGHIDEALSQYNIELPVYHWVLANLDELDTRLPPLPMNTLLFVLGAMPGYEGGPLLGVEEMVAYVRARTPLPIYTDLDKAVGHGTIGGYMNSGFKTGRMVAQLAARVLAGEAAEKIPIIYDPPLSLKFDYRELRRHGVPLAALPEGAEMLHTPPSILDPEYRSALISFSIIVTCLVFALGILTVRHRLQVSRQAALRYQATHDALTGVANRSWLLEHLSQQENTPSAPWEGVAVVMIDLNRFKLINDTYGHAFGDEVIIAVAQRLKESLVPDKEALVRFSGDAFAILLRYQDEEVLENLEERCEKSLAKPFQIHGKYIPVSAAFGISTTCLNRIEPDRLLREADTAMYEAKRNGCSQVQRFDKAIQQRSVRRFQIETRLPMAIEQNEIKLHFQPIVNSDNCHISGFEALAIWSHNELGAIPAVEFSHAARDSGLITQLTLYILHRACQTFRPHLTAIGNPYLAVNISVLDIYAEEFSTHLGEILSEEGIPPDRLVLEITEDMLLGNVDVVIQALSRLRELGVRVAIDDFGTGYASMSYLSNYMVNIIKIDKSFVRNILSNESDQKIVRAIVSMAKDLELNLVTEGVESTAQISMLRSLGCRFMQGYAYGTPKPPSEYPPDLLLYPVDAIEAVRVCSTAL
jgi:diguanylate cyclase (GGDEF)-like protein